MKEQKEDRKTIFRRIGGRIVPISVGAGAIALAGSKKAKQLELKVADKIIRSDLFHPKSRPFAGSFIQGSAAGSDKRIKAAQNFTFAFKKKYKAALDSAGNPPIFFSAFGKDGGRYGIQSKVIEINGKNSAIALHELGHAKSFFRAKMKMGFNTSELDKTFSKPIGILHDKILDSKMSPRLANYLTNRTGSLYHYARKVGTLATEIDAWNNAFNMTKNKVVRKSLRSSAAFALTRYAAHPSAITARYSLYAGGAAAIGYGLFRSNKK